MIRRIRERGAIATLITNGYMLTRDRIQRLNRSGLDYMQISIDNVRPDETSKKSLKVLDRKLEALAEHAEFGVTINSVLGAAIRAPEDAFRVGERARQLVFTSTVGILHDHSGQLKPLAPAQQSVYARFRGLKTPLFSFAHFDSFQENISRGVPNDWHCRAGQSVCSSSLMECAPKTPMIISATRSTAIVRRIPGHAFSGESKFVERIRWAAIYAARFTFIFWPPCKPRIRFPATLGCL